MEQASRPKRHPRGARVPPDASAFRVGQPLRSLEEEIIRATGTTLAESVGLTREVSRNPLHAHSCDDHLTPARNQGSRPTCVAFAVAAALEAKLVAEGEEAALDLSEQFLYWAAKDADGDNAAGTWISQACQCIEDRRGVCREQTWPYNATPIPGDEGQGPPPKHAIAEARTFSAHALRLNEREPGDLKRALNEDCNHIMFACFTFPFWEESPFSDTGDLPMPLPDEQDDGAHAICIYGYRESRTDPGGGVFLFKNSWGTRWGDSGHGTIPFQYVENHGLEAYSFI